MINDYTLTRYNPFSISSTQKNLATKLHIKSLPWLSQERLFKSLIVKTFLFNNDRQLDPVSRFRRTHLLLHLLLLTAAIFSILS